ncbi:hypothetical protein Y10_21910 [Neptunitalea sp. Y10]|uniref:OmpA-like domain-containing protein n=2 Tax=Neptunitalea lumnitzerae TaxID=2965509 RepID=A0ABQ5MK80_9FLAO|nr:hypothetical protein Y10_21910 [Neptunitalea sp. Y10]
MFLDMKAFANEPPNNRPTLNPIEVQSQVNCNVLFLITIKAMGTGELIPNSLLKIKDSDNNILKILTANRDGFIAINLPCKKDYKLEIYSEGYENKMIEIKYVNNIPIILEINLEPLLKSSNPYANFSFNPIFFDVNDTNINTENKVQLDALTELMKKYPGINIKIEAYADIRGSESYNLKLTDKRAKTLKQYLISRGISEERLISEGMGEINPLIDCKAGCTSEDLQKNRRADIVILNYETNELDIPSPSEIEKLSPHLFSTSKTLNDLDLKLTNALANSGYKNIRYYIKDKGYAIITQIEQTNKNWVSLNDANRWVVGNEPARDPSENYFYYWLYPVKGYYRFFIFLVHNETVQISPRTAINSQIAKDILSNAIYRDLPDDLKTKMAENYKVTVFIYQFEKRENEKIASHIKLSPNPGENLKLSGILKTLEND